MNQISPKNPPVIDSQGIKSLQDLMQQSISDGTAVNAEPLTKLEHFFAPGLYARSLWRPAGTLIVGKIHRHACLTVLLSGRLTVWTNSETRELVAPAVFVSKAGDKRVTLAHEDSVLMTVHGTSKTDLDELESELIVPEVDLLPDSYKEFLEAK